MSFHSIHQAAVACANQGRATAIGLTAGVLLLTGAPMASAQSAEVQILARSDVSDLRDRLQGLRAGQSNAPLASNPAICAAGCVPTTATSQSCAGTGLISGV